jgi:hypothetical protein
VALWKTQKRDKSLADGCDARKKRMFSDFGSCWRFWAHLADDGKLSILFFKFEMAVVIVHVNPT